MTQAPGISFRYRASPSLLAALAVVAVLAIAAVLIAGVPAHWRALLCVLVGVMAGMSTGRLLRPRVSSVAWRGDGTIELALNAAPSEGTREVRAERLEGRVMGPLLVLALRWPSRRRAYLWLLPDNLDADTRRRLRMRLGTHAARRLSGNTDSG